MISQTLDAVQCRLEHEPPEMSLRVAAWRTGLATAPQPDRSPSLELASSDGEIVTPSEYVRHADKMSEFRIMSNTRRETARGSPEGCTQDAIEHTITNENGELSLRA